MPLAPVRPEPGGSGSPRPSDFILRSRQYALTSCTELAERGELEPHACGELPSVGRSWKNSRLRLGRFTGVHAPATAYPHGATLTHAAPRRNCRIPIKPKRRSTYQPGTVSISAGATFSADRPALWLEPPADGGLASAGQKAGRWDIALSIGHQPDLWILEAGTFKGGSADNRLLLGPADQEGHWFVTIHRRLTTSRASTPHKPRLNGC